MQGKCVEIIWLLGDEGAAAPFVTRAHPVPSPFGRPWPLTRPFRPISPPTIARSACSRSRGSLSRSLPGEMVRTVGLEPTRCEPLEPKSSASTSSATLAKAKLSKTGGAPRATRTPDPQVRSLMLYPAELWARTESPSLPGKGLRFDPWVGRIGRRMLKAPFSFALTYQTRRLARRASGLPGRAGCFDPWVAWTGNGPRKAQF